MRGSRRAGLALVAAAAAALGLARCASEPTPGTQVNLVSCPIEGTDEQMRCGSYEVFEDRQASSGRRIALDIAVLPALSSNPRPDPIFYLAGGPGASATARAASFRSSWMRIDRDLVMVDQRGTGGSNPLRCSLRGGPDDAQGYLFTGFEDPELLRACRSQLEAGADLSLYTTPLAMDDIDEVRSALGYDTINLLGLSWGSRSALVYMRQHPRQVRRAILSGIAPTALRYPLYHARDSQRAVDLIFDECEGDAACSAAFPRLRQEFQEILERLERSSVTVALQHPDTGQRVVVELTRPAFTEWVRWFITSRWGTRWFPAYLHSAHEGDFEPLAQDLVETTQFYNQRLAMGQILSVVCPEDVARIDPGEVEAATRGTFMGDARVWQLFAACAVWPAAQVPAGYGDPVESDVPTLLWSGTLDPRTPPYWGAEAARHLSHGLNLVVPDAHGVEGPCIDAVDRAFLDSPTPTEVDTSCISSITLPPFEIPR